MKTIYQTISPEIKTFDSEEKKAALQNAIKNLPEEQQKILALHFTEKIPVKKIAEQWECSVTPIYKRLYAAIYKLQKEFYPEYFSEAYMLMYGNPDGPVKN